VVLSFFILITGLTASGYFIPGSLNWGFHFLGLLPLPYFYCYLIACFVIIAYALRGEPEKIISVLTSKIFKRPALSVVVSLFLFVAFAFTVRQRIPLLGDSFILINNLLNTLNGAHALTLYREPLAMYFFYYTADFLHTLSYPAIMNAFLVGEFILGIGFILNLIIIVRSFLPDPKAMALSLCFLLAGSYMQVFFGYGEIYSVPLFFISCYVMVVALWVRQKSPFYYIPVVFLFQVVSHYLTVLLVPSLVVITYIEYKSKGMRNIVIGYMIPCVVVLLILVALNFQLSPYIPPLSHAPFLSITPSSDGFQAYTLFSVYHLIDLFNLVMLLGSSAFMLFMFMYLFERKNAFKTVQGKFLLACIVPIIIFVVMAKFDLGTATDWDAVAPYFFLLNLCAVIIFMEVHSIEKIRILFLCIGFTFLHSMLWFTVNASENPTLVRTGLLDDERLLSHEGFFQHDFHLGGYYFSKSDAFSTIELWEGYFKRYPNDEKAFNKVVDILVQDGKVPIDKIVNLCESFFAANPRNINAKNKLVGSYVSFGNYQMTQKKFEDAKITYKKALDVNPDNIEALNNMGVVYMDEDNLDSARHFFLKVIHLDSTYVVSINNLGETYILSGESKKAIEIFERIVNQFPTTPTGYEKLAKVYYKTGDRDSSIVNLKQAARLGSFTAQNFLLQQKIRW
jgi:tetratricopeptide (TPR) repeat protein